MGGLLPSLGGESVERALVALERIADALEEMNTATERQRGLDEWKRTNQR